MIYGSGEQTRCFTFVDDLVDGLLKSMDSDEVDGQTFNLGSEVETSVNEVVHTILRACSSDLSPVHIDMNKELGDIYEDIERRAPDASRAARLLGWKAETPITTGIRITAEWMKHNSSNFAGSAPLL